MKILVLTFYYPPDLSAGSFRAEATVKALTAALPSGSHIDIVTTHPNRYSSFAVNAVATESSGAVSVRRIALPAHQSGMLDQSRAFLTFAREARRATAGTSYDLVFATSSRLMTAALGAWIARRKRIPLYLDIRDIFVDTIKDVLPRHWAIAGRPAFSLLERWAIETAERVNLVSKGFSGYFSARYPKQRFSYFSNGIDEEFLGVNRRESGPSRDARGGEVLIVCAGNLGEGQGLHAIVPKLAQRMRGRARFRIIGDGGRRDALSQALTAAGVDNVEMLPPVKRDLLIEAYRQADVLFLHLNDYEAFKKVLPSKLFEYAAMGKPVWAGVAGYAADFVRTEIVNAAVFPPCNVEAALRAYDELELDDTPRADFVAKYARTAIARAMSRDILEVASSVGD